MGWRAVGPPDGLMGQMLLGRPHMLNAQPTSHIFVWKTRSKGASINEAIQSPGSVPSIPCIPDSQCGPTHSNDCLCCRYVNSPCCMACRKSSGLSFSNTHPARQPNEILCRDCTPSILRGVPAASLVLCLLQSPTATHCCMLQATMPPLLLLC